MNETHKSLVLCSGGLDSVIVAAKLKSEGKDVTMLYINYGNQNYLPEVRAVLDCALEMKMVVQVLQFADTLWQNTPMTSAQADRGLKGQQAHVPGRNMVLLAIAAGFAATNGFDSVAIGNVADGTDGDNKVEFTNRFDSMLEYATAPYASVKCLAPIVHLTKAEGVKLGASLKVPFELTWSCYRSKGTHCGDCDGCINRRNSFTKAGVADPTRYLTVSK